MRAFVSCSIKAVDLWPAEKPRKEGLTENCTASVINNLVLQSAGEKDGILLTTFVH